MSFIFKMNGLGSIKQHNLVLRNNNTFAPFKTKYHEI